MKIVKILGIALIALGLYACGNEVPAESVKFSELENFFVKSDAQATETEEFFVVNNQKAFSNLFGAARTMDNTIEEVKFSKYFVVAIVLRDTSDDVSVHITSVEKKGRDLNIRYNVKRGEKRSYRSVPFKAITVEKGNYDNVSFFENKKLKETIPMKAEW